MSQQTLTTSPSSFARGSIDPLIAELGKANANFTELYALLAALGGAIRTGRATLVAGTVTVNDAATTAASNIFLTCQTPGGTPGFLRVSARTASTSFTILSSSNTDTSVVGYFVIEPAA